jgi:hypothetical protein
MRYTLCSITAQSRINPAGLGLVCLLSLGSVSPSRSMAIYQCKTVRFIFPNYYIAQLVLRLNMSSTEWYSGTASRKVRVQAICKDDDCCGYLK